MKRSFKKSNCSLKWRRSSINYLIPPSGNFKFLCLWKRCCLAATESWNGVGNLISPWVYKREEKTNNFLKICQHTPAFSSAQLLLLQGAEKGVINWWLFVCMSSFQVFLRDYPKELHRLHSFSKSLKEIQEFSLQAAVKCLPIAFALALVVAELSRATLSEREKMLLSRKL